VFSIQCPSCRAKLKVPKAELIGQSLSCPRCSSMVVVQAPEGWQPPQTPTGEPAKGKSESPAGDPTVLAAKSAKATDSANTDSSKSPSSKSPAAAGRRAKPQTAHPQDLQETLPTTAGDLGWGEDLKLADLDPDLLGRERIADDVPSSEPAKPARSRAVGTATRPADAVLQAKEWDSEKTRRRRTLLLTVIGTLGALVVIGALVMYWSEQNARLAAMAKSQLKDSGGAAAKGPDAQGKAVDAGGAGDVPGIGNPAGEVGDGAGAKSDTPNGQLPGGAGDAAGAGTGPPREPGSGDAAVDAGGAGDGSDLPQPGDANRVTDPVVDPDGAGEPVNLEGLGRDEGVEASESSFEDVMGQIFGGGELTSEWDDPGLRSLQQGAADPLDKVLRVFAERDPVRRRSARFVKPTPRQLAAADIERGLTAKLPGYRHPAARVPQLMAVAETLSGLPVWLDIVRYQGQPVDLNQVRLVEVVQVSVPEMLTTHLEPYGLTAEQHAWNPNFPDVFGFRLFPLGGDQMVAKTYPTQWLTAGMSEELVGPAEAKLQELIVNFIAPGEWGPLVEQAKEDPQVQLNSGLSGMASEAGAVTVVGYPHVQAKVERLLRQLETARVNQGQPLDWPRELEPLAVQESGRLLTVINLRNYQTVPLRDLFEQIHQQSNVTVLADWPSLVPEGWTPDTAVPMVAKNQVVETVLRELCLDMGVNFRLLAPDVVGLLSDSAEERLADLEVYPIADLVPGPRQWQLFRSRLNSLLREEFSRFPSAYLYYDPDFGCLIARLPQSSHQRLHVYLQAARRQ